MFICSRCKKPVAQYGIPDNRQFCHCSRPSFIGEITNQPIVCPGYEALVARTDVPKAFYDAFDEDTKA